MKKAFTLIELIIVIGIIGILSATLLVSFSGGSESARNAKCLTNMRNLAAACQTFGMANHRYPPAGSFEKFKINESRGIRNSRYSYYESPGWLSWDSQSAYKSGPGGHVASASWFTSCYNQEFEVREYALTNGALWKYVSGNRDIFVCPKHKEKSPKGLQPLWSYVMNSYFCWDKTQGSRGYDEEHWGIEYGSLSKPDRTLLFAELPFTEQEPNAAAGLMYDCTLQYETKYGGEYIGFNHNNGKKNRFAHVVFADGHVEKITYPVQSGLSRSQARDLTEWLCTGKDIQFDGHTYRKLTN